MDEAFGRTAAWAVGVEEELMLLDAETHAPVAAAPRLLARGAEGVKAELFQYTIETTTPVCADPEEAAASLVELRARVAGLCADEGVVVAAAGSHPFAIPEEQPITDARMYADLRAAAGPAAKRQGVQGLHVHVAMPDGETCVRAHENALPWLPVVLAVSANSPWFRGTDSGFLSKRAEVLASLARGGMPPPFGSYGEWLALMERWTTAGVVERPTSTWWDVRVHPTLGTLELRIADQPTDPAVAGALVHALHALAVWAAGAEPRLASRADYQTNRFHAARFGPRAELVFDDRLVPVPELWARLVELVGAPAGLLDPTRCEADTQLGAGSPRAAIRGVVERSLASPA